MLKKLFFDFANPYQEETKMKTKAITALTLSGLLLTGLTPVAMAATPAKMKMTTEIPANVLIPDKVETRLGTL